MLKIKYRTWFKGEKPRPIKLEIPGWAGDVNNHSNGDKPQPWHCPPFVEGSSYGLELIYPFDTEIKVVNIDGKIDFIGDFSNEIPPNNTQFPPFIQFAPGHYGFTSSLDIEPPPGYIIRLEPHPKFYTDETGTVPLCVPGHIQGEWWPRIFFVVFKSPKPNEFHIFKKGNPYAQILILPKKQTYEIVEMSQTEANVRAIRDSKIMKYREIVAKNSWSDHLGNLFDDKYKVLSGVFAKGGLEAVDKCLDQAAVKHQEKTRTAEKSRAARFPRKLI